MEGARDMFTVAMFVSIALVSVILLPFINSLGKSGKVAAFGESPLESLMKRKDGILRTFVSMEMRFEKREIDEKRWNSIKAHLCSEYIAATKRMEHYKRLSGYDGN
ncbi:MAG: hypothetical protein HQK54_07755 [Oligoflexales bacterium]|nr:hypothetical protein [Oligoflexales bacterium]